MKEVLNKVYLINLNKMFLLLSQTEVATTASYSRLERLDHAFGFLSISVKVWIWLATLQLYHTMLKDIKKSPKDTKNPSRSLINSWTFYLDAWLTAMFVSYNSVLLFRSDKHSFKLSTLDQSLKCIYIHIIRHSMHVQLLHSVLQGFEDEVADHGLQNGLFTLSYYLNLVLLFCS